MRDYYQSKSLSWIAFGVGVALVTVPMGLVISELAGVAIVALVIAYVAIVVGVGYLALAKRRSALWSVLALISPLIGLLVVALLPRVRMGALAVTTAAESDDAILTALGMKTDDGELRAACSRIARRIHSENLRVVGFVPSHDEVAIPPIIIQLGLSLTELTGATIAVVDANVRYPGLAALNRGKQTDSDDTVFSTRWLHGSLALLSPPRVERAGEVVPQLARALLDGSDLFAHVLVDLTGFELLGEHGSAAACMDAVALVARAHYTHEGELLQLAPLMPQNRFLGVLLVG